jgi:predicted DNA-binding transcriptional regulator AlpA
MGRPNAAARYERAWLSQVPRLAEPPRPRRLGAPSDQEQLAKAQAPLSDLVSPRAVRLALGVSASTLHRMRRQGDFPKAMKISLGRVGWPRAVVEQWIASREPKP